jgi:hypothetical protein
MDSSPGGLPPRHAVAPRRAHWPRGLHNCGHMTAERGSQRPQRIEPPAPGSRLLDAASFNRSSSVSLRARQENSAPVHALQMSIEELRFLVRADIR